MASIPRTDSIRRKLEWRHWPTRSIPHDYGLAHTEAILEDSKEPELEDQSLVAWGLAQSELGQNHSATVDVLSARGVDLNWKENVKDDELEKALASEPVELSNGHERHVRMIFINTLGSSTGWLPGNFSIPPNTLRILQRAGLSTVVLSHIFDSEGVWSKMGNQCFQHNDDKKLMSSIEVTYRYLCGWNTGAGFMQFVRTRHLRTYFCINYPSGALERFKAYLNWAPSLVYRDFFLNMLCADDCSKEWQYTIGQRRDRLLGHERKYEHGDIDFNKSIRELHRLSRDWHTLGQDCLDFHAQLQFLKTSYKRYMQSLRDAKHGWELDETTDLCDSLDVLISQCDNYARWTVVYRDRTNIRINLLFHLVNQREAQTNTQIAASTAKVAEQTQRDSASMITIAAVTMLFLPGTFISAILSTTFFDYGIEGLNVSKAWWILPATTIPLTLFVFGIWLGWRYLKLKRVRVNKKLP